MFLGNVGDRRGVDGWFFLRWVFMLLEGLFLKLESGLIGLNGV